MTDKIVTKESAGQAKTMKETLNGWANAYNQVSTAEQEKKEPLLREIEGVNVWSEA
jgi:hypothetical protein